jgi:hypothetical protein
MKLLLEILLIVHGLLHLPAFVRAFSNEPTVSTTISSEKKYVTLWLIAALLFFITAGLIHFNSYYWWIVSSIAIIVSQLNILIHWKETKSGTLVNLVLGIATYMAIRNASDLHNNFIAVQLLFHFFYCKL